VSTELQALEASIDAAVDDASRYAVLGDWYAQSGHPRGELIALQLDSARSKARKERETALLMAPGVRISQSQRAQWRWGFVHTLLFELVHHDAWEGHPEDWPEVMLAPELAHPSCRFLRGLVVDASPGDRTLDFLSARLPRHVSTLTMICNEVDLARATGALERLERVQLSAQLITPAALALPKLNELALPIDAMTVGGLGLVLSSLPSLRSLTLSSLETIDRDALFPVVQRTGLERLVLRADQTSRSAVEAIVDSPLRESLVTLDISRSGMTEEAAQRLLKLTPKFARLADLITH
jgi:hypothetical protein